MTGHSDAAADSATGGRARAIDPAGARLTHRGGPGALCLNCGTRLIGDHCHACGQAAHVHRSLGAVAHEIGHGVFHFEGRIWRTLPMLLVHPGALTRRYVDGERARFVSPLALFLFSVFLMFATISALGPGDFGGTAPRFTLDTPDSPDIRAGSGWLGRVVAKARENPGLVAYKLQSSAYKFSWALIPLSTPFVALMFLWRRRYRLYDHAIFVTYSLCFMTLLVVALTLASAAGAAGGLVVPAAIIAPPLHMYTQLRGAYLLRRRSASWRTALLVGFSFAVLVLFSLGLVALGLSR